MDEMQVAGFRTNFSKLTDPTRVMRYRATVGDWFPGGHECATDNVVAMGKAAPAAIGAARTRITELEEEVARLKRLLAAASAKDGRPFHPVPKTGHAPEAEASALDRRDASTNTEEHRLAEQKRTRDELGEAQRRRDQALRAAFPQKARP